MIKHQVNASDDQYVVPGCPRSFLECRGSDDVKDQECWNRTSQQAQQQNPPYRQEAMNQVISCAASVLSVNPEATQNGTRYT
jgi:hypothetical protein